MAPARVTNRKITTRTSRPAEDTRMITWCINGPAQTRPVWPLCHSKVDSLNARPARRPASRRWGLCENFHRNALVRCTESVLHDGSRFCHCLLARAKKIQVFVSGGAMSACSTPGCHCCIVSCAVEATTAKQSVSASSCTLNACASSLLSEFYEVMISHAADQYKMSPTY